MNQVDEVRRLLIKDEEFERVHAGIPVELMRRRLDALGYDWQALVADCTGMPELRVIEREVKHNGSIVETRIGIGVTWPDGSFDTQKEHCSTRVVPHARRDEEGKLVHKFGIRYDPEQVSKVANMLVSDVDLKTAVGTTFPLDCLRRRFERRGFDWVLLMNDVEGAKVVHENGKHGSYTPSGVLRIVRRSHVEWPDGSKDTGETLYEAKKPTP